MFWVTLITGIVILTLLIVYSPMATSKDPEERKKFNLIWQIGLAVILLERLISNWLD